MQDVQDGLEGPEVERSARHPKSDGARAFVDSERAVRAIYLVVGAVTIGLIFWRLQFSNQSVCCGDFDGYYHIRWI
jgi:broad specificity phosphatase PhoE